MQRSCHYNVCVMYCAGLLPFVPESQGVQFYPVDLVIRGCHRFREDPGICFKQKTNLNSNDTEIVWCFSNVTSQHLQCTFDSSVYLALMRITNIKQEASVTMVADLVSTIGHISFAVQETLWYDKCFHVFPLKEITEREKARHKYHPAPKQIYDINNYI